MAVDRTMGLRVARLRKRRGLTRQQFADLCGRSVSWVDKVERGERGLVRLPMLEQVAAVLGVSFDALTADSPRPASSSPRPDAFEVRTIREALQRYEAFTEVFQPATLAEPSDLRRLQRQVAYVWMSFQNADYSVMGRILPALLRDAQAAASALSGTDDLAVSARTLLSQTYQVTASVLWKIREIDLAWLAAERALVIAESTGDPLLISDAARRVAQGLMTTGHHDQALQLLQADIQRLEPGRGTASPEYLSLYGMLFLMGAVVAARAAQGATARALLREGQEIAAQLGSDRNERFTSFGPTNVRLHSVSTLIDLHDGRTAVALANAVHPEHLSRLPKERRANFYLDVARGHAQERHRDEALACLLQAETLAPDEVRCRPLALSLTSDLQQQWVGSTPWPLRQLVGRAGLSARE